MNLFDRTNSLQAQSDEEIKENKEMIRKILEILKGVSYEKFCWIISEVMYKARRRFILREESVNEEK